MITSDKLRDIWEAKWKSRRSGNGALGHYRPLVIVLENRWKCESYILLQLGSRGEMVEKLRIRTNK